MNSKLSLIHNRNLLMANLLWVFFLVAIVINAFIDPKILLMIIPVGLIVCSFVSICVWRKWAIEQAPYIIVTAIFIFFFSLIVFEPLLINFIYVWFALILSSIYQQYKPILLAGLYAMVITIFVFIQYHQEIFPFLDMIDITYLVLFTIFVTIFLIFSSKFNERLHHKLETEKREAEELLRKSDKLAVVGQLAAGVAHEIRNPLAVISGFIQLMRTENKKSKYFNIMLEELNRINLIISEFLVLAKPQVIKLEKKNIKIVLNEVITLVNTQAILKNIEICLPYKTDDILIMCEENQLKQVFINILKNAIEAMPNGGKIQTEISKVNEEYIKISIIDQGKGISKEEIAMLGEPFYTTKQTGTGLGLMVSFKIIENHHGKIHFTSEPNQGTTVEILLPIQIEKSNNLKMNA